MQAFGDNIYHHTNGVWYQANSFHSRPDGSVNRLNLAHDTSSSNVLISLDFAYWGCNGPAIPPQFREYHNIDVVAKRGHHCIFPDELVIAFVTWVRSLNRWGYIGAPVEWEYSSRSTAKQPAFRSWR